jgi:hypothetical protein
MTMPAFLTKSAPAAAIAGLALILSGCTESRLRLSDDYGHAVRENIVAQVRYNHNAVIRPATTSTSNTATGGGGGGSGGPSS